MSIAKRLVCEPRSFKLAFRDDAAVNIADINDEILDSVSKYAGKAVLGYTLQGRAVTFEELAHNGIPDILPAEGTETVRALTFDFKDDRLFVMDRQSIIPLARLKLTVAYRLGGEPESGSDGKPVEAEEDDYTEDVFVNTKEG